VLSPFHGIDLVALEAGASRHRRPLGPPAGRGRAQASVGVGPGGLSDEGSGRGHVRRRSGRPPWASATERAIGRPSPEPPSRRGSRSARRSARAAGSTPGPSSSTSMRQPSPGLDDPDLDALAGVTAGVVQQVGHRLLDRRRDRPPWAPRPPVGCVQVTSSSGARLRVAPPRRRQSTTRSVGRRSVDGPVSSRAIVSRSRSTRLEREVSRTRLPSAGPAAPGPRWTAATRPRPGCRRSACAAGGRRHRGTGGCAPPRPGPASTASSRESSISS
jgi:hypothetical protein